MLDHGTARAGTEIQRDPERSRDPEEKGRRAHLIDRGNAVLSTRMPAVLHPGSRISAPPLSLQGAHPHTLQHPHTPVPGFGAGGGAQLVPGGTALRHAPAAAGSWEALLGAAGAGDLAGLFGAAGGRVGDKAGAAPNAEINPVQVKGGWGIVCVMCVYRYMI